VRDAREEDAGGVPGGRNPATALEPAGRQLREAATRRKEPEGARGRRGTELGRRLSRVGVQRNAAVRPVSHRFDDDGERDRASLEDDGCVRETRKSPSGLRFGRAEPGRDTRSPGEVHERRQCLGGEERRRDAREEHAPRGRALPHGTSDPGLEHGRSQDDRGCEERRNAHGVRSATGIREDAREKASRRKEKEKHVRRPASRGGEADSEEREGPHGRRHHGASPRVPFFRVDCPQENARVLHRVPPECDGDAEGAFGVRRVQLRRLPPDVDVAQVASQAALARDEGPCEGREDQQGRHDRRQDEPSCSRVTRLEKRERREGRRDREGRRVRVERETDTSARERGERVAPRAPGAQRRCGCQEDEGEEERNDRRPAR